MNDKDYAQKLLKKANNKMNKKNNLFYAFFVDSKQTLLDAANMYEKAANLFKISKCFELAADAYTSAAKCAEQSDNIHLSAVNYKHAGKCYIKCENIQKALDQFIYAAQLYGEHGAHGSFLVASRLYEYIGDIYEKENQFELAIQFYNSSISYINYCDTPNFVHNNTHISVKIAMIYAILEKYSQAIEILEDVTVNAWKCAEYLLKAGLCHLALDINAAQEAVIRYHNTYSTFINSREETFLEACINSVATKNMEKFNLCIAEYNPSLLMITILDKIKNKI